MQTSKNISIREYPLANTSDLERQVLADIVASPEAIGDVMRYITDEAFTTDDRKAIWRAAIVLFNKGQVIDMPTMLNVCGHIFLDECINHGKLGDTPRMAVQHAIHLRNAAARRRGYFAAVKMLQATVETDKTIDEICSIAEGLGREVQGNISTANEVPLKEVLADVNTELAELRRLKKEGRSYRVPTGIKAIDWNTYGGWRGGQLIILAARPSVGKTALMLKFARSAAEGGFPVDIFSLEMTAGELAQRMLYSTGEVKPTDIATGFVAQEKFDAARAELERLNIYINDASRSLEDITARLSINVRGGRCKVAFIDYLGLMNIATSYRENMNQAIGKITSELKATAKRLNIPIVLLCQLNRDAAKNDRAPELYDLRDSGSIEQDADVVMMLENEEAQNPDTGLHDINIWLRKNRQYKRDICIRVSPNSTYSDFAEVGVEITPEAAVALGSGSGLTDEDEDNEQTLFD